MSKKITHLLFTLLTIANIRAKEPVEPIWYTDIDSAMVAAKESNKILMLYFSYSKYHKDAIEQFNNKIFSQDEFKQWANTHVVLLRIDEDTNGISNERNQFVQKKIFKVSSNYETFYFLGVNGEVHGAFTGRSLECNLSVWLQKINEIISNPTYGTFSLNGDTTPRNEKIKPFKPKTITVWKIGDEFKKNTMRPDFVKKIYDMELELDVQVFSYKNFFENYHNYSFEELSPDILLLEENYNMPLALLYEKSINFKKKYFLGTIRKYKSHPETLGTMGTSELMLYKRSPYYNELYKFLIKEAGYVNREPKNCLPCLVIHLFIKSEEMPQKPIDRFMKEYDIKKGRTPKDTIPKGKRMEVVTLK